MSLFILGITLLSAMGSAHASTAETSTPKPAQKSGTHPITNDMGSVRGYCAALSSDVNRCLAPALTTNKTQARMKPLIT